MAIEDYVTRGATAATDSFEWGQIEWLDGADVTAGGGLSVARVTIEAGEHNSPHRHPTTEEALYLVSGEIDHWLGSTDEFVSLEPGDLFHVPSGEPHGATTTGEEAAVMIVAYDSAERDIEFVE